MLNSKSHWAAYIHILSHLQHIYTPFSVSPVIEVSRCLLRTCSLTTELSHKHGKIPSMSVKILAAQETTWLVWQIEFHEGLSSWLYGWYCTLTFPPRMFPRLPQAPGSKAPLLALTVADKIRVNGLLITWPILTILPGSPRYQRPGDKGHVDFSK